MGTVKIKRIYEQPEKADGLRILVDRLWPRGVKKESAELDSWMKEVAPTPDLRKWFNHEPAKWDEFKARYIHELKHNEALDALLEKVKDHKVVTLLYAAKDEHYNHAAVLHHFLKSQH